MLMEKQHNRGQDGAGIGALKLNMQPGQPYLFRERSSKPNALIDIFSKIIRRYHQHVNRGVIIPELPRTVKTHFDFGAEILLGHLRYGTSGSYGPARCHPYLRPSSWPTRSLMLAGNFNITNNFQLNKQLIDYGQHPIFDTDTQTLLEAIGYQLDEMHNHLYRTMRDQGVPGSKIPQRISAALDPAGILREAARDWDGGYVIAGVIGNGDAFVLRDPWGIRSCFYFRNEELIAFASERVPLMTVFDQKAEDIHEVPPAHVAVIKHDGSFSKTPYTEARERKSCSFERIYFSRGNDPDIYKERRCLGGALAEQVLKAIDNDLGNTVVSYIPNTAEVAYYGLMHRLRQKRRVQVKAAILAAASKGTLDEALIDKLVLTNWPRVEKVAHKDIKLRTFISQEKERETLASHVYDITYGVVKPTDTLVMLDDSIVRGTTLRRSILRILSRTQPKKIIIISTAPQIRYPDCYGIDMSEMRKFIAFQAAVAILNESGKRERISEVYRDCIKEIKRPVNEQRNHVKRIYEDFSPQQISCKIAQLVYPGTTDWNGELEIFFQTIENLHRAIPNHLGDWYFTGDYPTPGGVAAVNRAFIKYYEQKRGRGYS